MDPQILIIMAYLGDFYLIHEKKPLDFENAEKRQKSTSAACSFLYRQPLADSHKNRNF